MHNELAHKKAYASALTTPAISQCKPNENLLSCNGKLKKKKSTRAYHWFHDLLSYIKGVHHCLCKILQLIVLTEILVSFNSNETGY